jgi:hypothetical protein
MTFRGLFNPVHMSINFIPKFRLHASPRLAQSALANPAAREGDVATNVCEDLQVRRIPRVSFKSPSLLSHHSPPFLLSSFYNGLSASLLRQLTYTTTRFAVYETAKKQATSDLNFLQKMGLAGIAGSLEFLFRPNLDI